MGECCDLVSEFFGSMSCVPIGNDVFAKTDLLAFVSCDLPPGQDEIECTSLSDEARKSNGASVDERNSPSSAVHPHVGAFFHHPNVGPHGKLHAACNGRPSDGGDNRLVEFESARPHRSHRNVPTVAVLPPISRHRKFSQRLRLIESSSMLEVPTCAKSPALAPKDRNPCAIIVLKLEKCVVESRCALGIHCVSGFRTRVDHRPHWP